VEVNVTTRYCVQHAGRADTLAAQPVDRAGRAGAV